MAYRDEFGYRDGDLEDKLDHAWQIGYREGVDAVMSYLDTESSFQVRCLIEEGQI